MKELLNIAKKRIIPSDPEQKDMSDFVKLLKNATTSKYNPIVCGSVGKSTWLAHRREADIFLLFSPDLTKKQLEIQGLKEGKKIVKKLKGKWKLAYSEHPYLQALFTFRKKQYEVDIVPAFAIKNSSNIKSAVDRTPHHMKFILKNLKNNNDVRLLKQFCIAHECYGADLKVLGFSGYLCELLIVKYKTFSSCIKAVSKWKPGKTIIVGKQSPTKKFSTPLVVIDPVDPSRNVAAVVSEEKFFTFVQACQKFLASPSMKHFFPPEVKPIALTDLKKKINKRKTKLLLFSFKKPKSLEDILWAQTRKLNKLLERKLQKDDFTILKKGTWMDKKQITLVFEVDNWVVSKVKKQIGPDIKSKAASLFLKHYKNKKVSVERGRYVVEVPRKRTQVLPYMKDFFIGTAKKLHSKGVPSRLASPMTKARIEMFPDKSLVLKSHPEDFFKFLQKWFKR
jgi:tRNA nucleotidyltransferase (CCA-adding enzyme)